MCMWVSVRTRVMVTGPCWEATVFAWGGGVSSEETDRQRDGWEVDPGAEEGMCDPH